RNTSPATASSPTPAGGTGASATRAADRRSDERSERTVDRMYLITGGAGFIGANVAEALVHAGEKVRGLDNLTTGPLDNLAAVRDRVEIVEGDLRDYDAVRRAMEGVQYVSHQAALRSVERSVDDPLSSDEVNVHGTLHVLMAAREAKTVKRIAYASSSSV